MNRQARSLESIKMHIPIEQKSRRGVSGKVQITHKALCSLIQQQCYEHCG